MVAPNKQGVIGDKLLIVTWSNRRHVIVQVGKSTPKSIDIGPFLYAGFDEKKVIETVFQMAASVLSAASEDS